MNHMSFKSRIIFGLVLVASLTVAMARSEARFTCTTPTHSVALQITPNNQRLTMLSQFKIISQVTAGEAATSVHSFRDIELLNSDGTKVILTKETVNEEFLKSLGFANPINTSLEVDSSTGQVNSIYVTVESSGLCM